MQGVFPEGDLAQLILQNVQEGVYCVDLERKLTFWNSSAERITGYTAKQVLGKSCHHEILQHVDDEGNQLCDGRCLLVQTLLDGAPRKGVIYLRHKEGHRVPVQVHVRPIRDPGGSIVGAVETFEDISERIRLEERVAQLEKMSTLDPLTGVPNRRYLDAKLTNRLTEMNRYGWPFGVMMIDIDHFKKVNDEYGHGVGDEILKMVAMTLAKNLRPFDSVGRWGGEEFLAIVTNVDHDHLAMLGERLRHLVQQSTKRMKGSEVSVTISVGITNAVPDDTQESLIRRADTLLYRSKNQGRNRVSSEVIAAR